MWQPCSIAHIDIHISKEFSIFEKGCIIDGITEWQQATNGLISFHIVDLNASEIVPNEIGDAWYVMNFIKVDGGGTIVGLELFYDTPGHIIGYAHNIFDSNFAALCVSRVNTKNIFRRLVVHEMGHMLGLPHIKAKAAMNGNIRMTTKINKLDLAQLIIVLKDYFQQ